VVRMLMDTGADVNAQGGVCNGNALQVASVEGEQALISLLNI
jgi:hypothetical protein